MWSYLFKSINLSYNVNASKYQFNVKSVDCEYVNEMPLLIDKNSAMLRKY